MQMSHAANSPNCLLYQTHIEADCEFGYCSTSQSGVLRGFWRSAVPVIQTISLFRQLSILVSTFPVLPARLSSALPGQDSR